MKKRCPTAVFIDTGYIKNYMIDYVGSRPDWYGAAYASISKKRGERVYGAIYQMDSATMNHLDMSENAPEDYKRIILPVTTKNGKITCNVYITEKMPHKKASRSYIRLVRMGATQRHLPKKYINSYL